jgi:hypothetical protein
MKGALANTASDKILATVHFLGVVKNFLSTVDRHDAKVMHTFIVSHMLNRTNVAVYHHNIPRVVWIWLGKRAGHCWDKKVSRSTVTVFHSKFVAAMS